MDFEALWLTLRLATGTTAILLAVALPLAWWIASGKGAGRAVVQAVVALPLVLPPTVLGFYLLVMLGPLTAPGRLLTRLFGHSLSFSFSGLLVGSVLYSLPFAVQPLVAGFGMVDRGYIEASAGLGASPWRTFWSVVMPLSRGGLLTSAVLAFTHTVGEFGVVLMIGGNIPGATQTLSISLYDQVQDFNYKAANQTALVLVAVSLAALIVIYSRRESGVGRGELV
ncbi:molybdate ABC transporter permease subunit [Edaphobacter dinghuensis]|uniref:Molybdenum transport system permease n=1 Tax=Edaphobacter dinghuensis TaxID=1560005 RepID=A0A917M4B6_9BACT|nr:molybdate ABC transporter permease subunit [Edaphobacter dinghuensis]GGG74660.1 molybdenum ABC transporter permease subunit [Edaphobacter dinghuensis]